MHSVMREKCSMYGGADRYFQAQRVALRVHSNPNIRPLAECQFADWILDWWMSTVAWVSPLMRAPCSIRFVRDTEGLSLFNQ